MEKWLILGLGQELYKMSLEYRVPATRYSGSAETHTYYVKGHGPRERATSGQRQNNERAREREKGRKGELDYNAKLENF